MLPNKLKITVSREIRNGDFSRLYYNGTACELSASNVLYGILCQNDFQRKRRKQCICGHKCEKPSEPLSVARTVF